MGDHLNWSPEPNDTVLEERPSCLSFSPPSSPKLPVFDSEFWPKAEEATREIIAQVQPTVVSEERRKAVIDYVQRLIKTTLGCEVYPFGSVPLKTYLPDGDIDLTAFGKLNFEEALATEVCSVLEREDINGASDFVVKDVQLIRAEVKLVKCLVQNIVVDISFNQIGGLCTLCFLEKVDRLIGKDHLFKRSIILIKAWCYYESRILGAHHGLISTYALETLVLYIFHLFHSSLDGPLVVLYKFLDYFSNFDWDNYCISLNGPIHLSSLPEVVVEAPENGGRDLLLTHEFLRECMEMCSVPSRGYDTTLRTFPSKHLNIVDPLKENNNLGRSVSKGNFYRIRSAFTYGARKLGRVLSHSEEVIADELRQFFANTLDRHGSGHRPDVQEPVPVTTSSGYALRSPVSGVDSFAGGQTVDESESLNTTGSITTSGRLNNEVSFSVRVDDLESSGFDPNISRSQRYADTENRFLGDAKDLATTKMQSLTVTDETKSSPRSAEGVVSPLSKVYRPPHLARNGIVRNGTTNFNYPYTTGFADLKTVSDIPSNADEEMSFSTCFGDAINHDGLSFIGLTHHPSPVDSVPWSTDDHYPSSSHHLSATMSAGSGALNQLLDLSGDYNNQLNSLQSGRQWLEYAPAPYLWPMSSPFLSQYQCGNSLDIFSRPIPFRTHLISAMGANGVVQKQVFVPINSQIVAGTGFGIEDVPKPRGTGTYFPNANHYRDRPYSPRGRNNIPARSPRNNGRAMAHSEGTFLERSSRNTAQAQFQNQQTSENPMAPDRQQPDSPDKRAFPFANGSIHPRDTVIEFGSAGTVPPSYSSSQESSSETNTDAGHHSPRPHKTKTVTGMHQDRISAQSYRLKDDEDFPPLSI